MNPSQQLLFKLMAKTLLGVLALQLGMALTAYIYVFVAPNLGHWPAFGIATVFLIGSFAAVITWMGRQWNEWHNR